MSVFIKKPPSALGLTRAIELPRPGLLVVARWWIVSGRGLLAAVWLMGLSLRIGLPRTSQALGNFLGICFFDGDVRSPRGYFPGNTGVHHANVSRITRGP